MQTDTEHQDNISVDAEELSRAQQLWHNFTLLLKWGIIACVVILILLGLVTL